MTSSVTLEAAIAEVPQTDLLPPLARSEFARLAMIEIAAEEIIAEALLLPPPAAAPESRPAHPLPEVAAPAPTIVVADVPSILAAPAGVDRELPPTPVLLPMFEPPQTAGSSVTPAALGNRPEIVDAKIKAKKPETEAKKRRPVDTDAEADERSGRYTPSRVIETRYPRERSREYALALRADYAPARHSDSCSGRPARWIGRTIFWGRGGRC